MPKLDRYGSQPPIELLRQYQDFGGFYDRDKLFWKEIHVGLFELPVIWNIMNVFCLEQTGQIQCELLTERAGGLVLV